MLCITILLLAAIIFGAIPVRAQEITPDKAGLNAAQVKLLKSLDTKILAPSYIPEGFEVIAVVASVKRARFGGGPSYAILYSGKNNQSFGIESTTGGIGDPPYDKVLTVTNPVLGKIDLLIHKQGFGGDVKPGFISGWIKGHGNFYHFIGAGLHSEIKGDNNVSEKEALKILKSLRYVKL